jgi:predicted nucleotide-binding protein
VAEVSGVYWCGKYMSLTDALQAEKDDFLRQARAALKRKQEAEAQAAAAAAERERQQQEFEQNAARGHYRKELALALTQYQKKLAIVSETEQAVAAARAERSKLECDVTTSVEKLQGLLARNADLLAVLTTRLTAHQDKANQGCA